MATMTRGIGRTLDRTFYQQEDVLLIARSLLGKVIVTEIDGELTSGYIMETEAYAGITDRASHAFGGKRTARTETMYGPGGTSYVYLCYGIHCLFNVVTNVEGTPHAVLLRALRPLHGIEVMRKRRAPNRFTTHGPGTLSRALGIRMEHNATDLVNGNIRIEDHGVIVPPKEVINGPRIGVDYAGMDSLLPYRFRIASSQAALRSIKGNRVE